MIRSPAVWDLLVIPVLRRQTGRTLALHGYSSLLSEFQASERLTEKQGGQYPRLFTDLHMYAHTEAQLGLGLDLAWVLVSTLESFSRAGCLTSKPSLRS